MIDQPPPPTGPVGPYPQSPYIQGPHPLLPLLGSAEPSTP